MGRKTFRVPQVVHIVQRGGMPRRLQDGGENPQAEVVTSGATFDADIGIYEKDFHR